MSDSKASFHPALAVSNIKTHINNVLEMENVQYSTWAELFKIHTRSHRVIDHIIPSAKGKEKVPTTDDEKELWDTLDATVLQWIYSTISSDLLNTIIQPDATAMEAWNRLRDIFQDNEHSRAVTLEQEFSSTHIRDFPNASTYCQRLKLLADQLKNVGALVSDSRLVLQLVAGLIEAYNGVGTVIRQAKPLPQFYQARSMLTLEEAGLIKKAATGSDAAMITTPYRDSDKGSSYSENYQNRGNKGQNRKNNKNSGGGWNSGKGGRGGGSGGGQGSRGARGGQQQHQAWQPANPWIPWVVPPCPFPTYNWVRPNATPRQQQPGLLGPRPQQVAFNANAP